MYLSQLTLTHFRKFSHLALEFPKEVKTFCFVGPNTIGKTNILEGIYFLTLLKSFRTNENEEMLQWEKEYLQVEGLFQGEEMELHLQVNALFHPRSQKRLRVNNSITPLHEYVGQVNVVFFSPDDINLLLLSPANRRKYMDILFSQTDSDYLSCLVHFQKALKQRNALIKTIARTGQNKDELDVWNKELAQWAVPIMRKRAQGLAYLSTTTAPEYQKIAHNESIFALTYHPSGKSIPENEEEFIKHLEERLPRDLGEECTTLGPHRDDFFFYLDGKSIDTFASRGDTRSMILALKLAEIVFIREKKKRNPILLLDDVFSELDEARQHHLLQTLPKDIQTLITTTNKEGNALRDSIASDVCFFDVENMIQ